MIKSRQAFPGRNAIFVVLALGAAACQKKDAPPKTNRPGPASDSTETAALTDTAPADSADSAAAPAGTAHAAGQSLFDSLGRAVAVDINGDGRMDTAKAARVASPAGVQAAFSVVVPENANGADAGRLSGWGLVLTLAAEGGLPRKADSLFMPGIPAVIYDQGGPEAVSPAASEDEAVRALDGKGVRQGLSLFTESGADILLYFADGKFSLYWPDEEG